MCQMHPNSDVQLWNQFLTINSDSTVTHQKLMKFVLIVTAIFLQLYLDNAMWVPYGNRLFLKSSTFQGVKIVIIPNKVTQNVELFVDALETCQVTRLFAVTSLIKNLLTFVQMEAKQKKSKPRLNKVIRILKLTIVCCGLNLLIEGWVNRKSLQQQEWYPII